MWLLLGSLTVEYSMRKVPGKIRAGGSADCSSPISLQVLEGEYEKDVVTGQGGMNLN